MFLNELSKFFGRQMVTPNMLNLFTGLQAKKHVQVFDLQTKLRGVDKPAASTRMVGRGVSR